jgi:hypothetical protein
MRKIKFILFQQKNSPQKPHTKVKRTREEMHVALENRRMTTTKSPRSVLKRKNIIEEGGASRLGVKK